MNQQELGRIVQPLLSWYERDKRDLPWRHTKDPYRIWLSEIMLQQTRVDTVISYYERFLRALPTVEALAACPEQKLLKLWEGLGYYNRVRNMQTAARQILEMGQFPNTRKEIAQLKGVGDYTAGAIASIAFDLPEPAVDGNVLRVLSRVTASTDNIDLAATGKKFTVALKEIYPMQNCGAFTQSLMELGALICVPNGAPNCNNCPLKEQCEAFKRAQTSKLPIRSDKKARVSEDLTVVIAVCGDRFSLCVRKSEGMLAGMCEFPTFQSIMDSKAVYAKLKDLGMMATLKESGAYRHIFTHREWKIHWYLCEVDRPNDKWKWIGVEDVAEHAIPTAYRPCLQAVRKYLGKRESW